MSEGVEVRHFINDEGVEMCFCSKERTYHPCSRFGRNKHSSTLFQYKCKACIKEERLNKRDDDPYRGPQSEILKSKHLLRLMGYDPDSEIPVHIQHQERVNERLRKRTETPSDDLPTSR